MTSRAGCSSSESRRKMRRWVVLAFSLVFCVGTYSFPASLRAQQSAADLVGQSEAPGLSEKDRQRQQESLQKELAGAYRKWLQEDVGYIITDEERKVFLSLNNDEERERLIGK